MPLNLVARSLEEGHHAITELIITMALVACLSWSCAKSKERAEKVKKKEATASSPMKSSGPEEESSSESEGSARGKQALESPASKEGCERNERERPKFFITASMGESSSERQAKRTLVA